MKAIKLLCRVKYLYMERENVPGNEGDQGDDNDGNGEKKIGDARRIIDKGPNMTNFDDKNELENISFDV